MALAAPGRRARGLPAAAVAVLATIGSLVPAPTALAIRAQNHNQRLDVADARAFLAGYLELA